jgi:hypothetical protein
MKLRAFPAIGSLVLLIFTRVNGAPPVDVAAYPTLQAAIDANPGRIIRIPPGEHVIDAALKITHDNTEIYGPARIIQRNPGDAIVRIENAGGIRLADLSFTRSEGRQEAGEAGIDVVNCHDVVLSRLRVTENHSHSSIRARDSRDVTVEGCTVHNYKGPTIDDRTAPRHLSGYAFKAIDGTGIQMLGVQGGVIRDNRIQEFRLLPTKEVREKYDLGAVTIMPKERGRLMTQDIFDTRFTNNWHQGSGIQVSNPDRSSRIIITGNYIEHPGQGIDLHCDNVIVSSNIISHSLIGMKAMHGSKNVLIDGNQFTHADLWGVMLMPGALSHVSANAGPGVKAATENVDGGTIISNNIFSDFGFGDQYWNWVDDKSKGPSARSVIAIRPGQLEENPPVRGVLVTGNLVYDSGRETVLVDGKWEKVPPRYVYALYVEQTIQPAPVNVRIFGNLLDPGLKGDTNFPAAKAVQP